MPEVARCSHPFAIEAQESEKEPPPVEKGPRDRALEGRDGGLREDALFACARPPLLVHLHELFDVGLDPVEGPAHLQLHAKSFAHLTHPFDQVAPPDAAERLERLLPGVLQQRPRALLDHQRPALEPVRAQRLE